MKSTLMLGFTCALCALILGAPALGGEDAAVAATPVEHAKPLPAPEGGVLGTRGYTPSEAEAPFFEKLDAGERVTGGFFSDYGITGKTGKRVGWFGIVRKITEDEVAGRTELLVEMKYFDGLTDLHLQLVSIAGAGDFRAKLAGIGLGIKHLSLVKVYGTVESETTSIPLLAAEFVRHWDWGLFSFMNYGEQKGNAEWRKLCRIPLDAIYSSAPNDEYYEARLGVRKAGADPAATADATTLDELARAVFDALRAGDAKLLDPVAVRVADVEWTFRHFQKREKLPGETKEAIEKLGGYGKIVEKSRTALHEGFEAVREAVADWSEARFGGLVRELADVSKQDGLETGNVVFELTAGNETYRVVLKGAGRVGRGWIVAEGMGLLD